MVRAGRSGSRLDLVQIADSLEADVRLAGRSALTYPIAVGIIAVLIVTGMLIFVVPVFSELFASFGGELPLPTQMLVNMSNLVKNPLFFVPILVIILTFTFWYRANKDSLRVRQVVDPMKFRLPVFGKLLQKVALARFTRNFSTLMHAGVPILGALDIVGETAGNIVISRAVVSVKEASGRARASPSHCPSTRCSRTWSSR